MTEQSTELEPGDRDPSPGAGSATQAPGDRPAPLSASDAALARYTSSMRRHRIVYFAIVGLVVVALGIGVGVAWSSGEVAHASLHTVASAPASIGVESPSRTLQQVWQTSDHIAIGAPLSGGTIITYSKHTVGGRDGRTGKRTWEYTRTDRNVCTAAQLTTTTIAIFANHGNCDEVSAFDSGTGQRRWTRTLDMDGMPLNGQPIYRVTPATLVVASPAVVYALDPVSGYNRWTYERQGCRIQGVALGGNGALISQNCSGQVKCSGVKFCGRGPQLLLRDGSAGRGDDSKPNADQIKWNRIGDTSLPVSADQVTSAVAPDGRSLYVLSVAKGRRDHRIPLTPASAQLGPITAAATADAEIVWIAGKVYAIAPDAAAPMWTAAAPSPPTVASTVREDTITLATARIAVPSGRGIALLDGNDGRTITEFSVRPPAPGSLVYSLGTGFVVSGPSGIVAYR